MNVDGRSVQQIVNNGKEYFFFCGKIPKKYSLNELGKGLKMYNYKEFYRYFEIQEILQFK